jgi:ppGpp synthetase/RelA/SpoT-type nucleotidyltranferase
LDDEYGQATTALQSIRLSLEGLIQVLLEGKGIRVHGVTSRIKSRASVRRKLELSAGRRTFSSLTDLLGIRVITYFPDEVNAVANVIEREFKVDKENSVDKRAILDPDRFGYLSLHYVLQLSDSRSRLPEYHAFRDLKFELQIRSILQHAWAEIEHDLGYHSKVVVPVEVRRRFSRLAGLLELADAEFLGIREQLAQSDNGPRSAVEETETHVSQLLRQHSPVALPDWPQHWTEAEYNAWVAHSDAGFLLLDKVLIKIPASEGRFEACDLLGPNDELIHVKRARTSAGLGHLCNQALISAEILLRFPDARQALAEVVRSCDTGRELPLDFRPRDVVLAIPSNQGPVMTVAQIPALARITLARVAHTLESQGVALHVVGIPIVESPLRQE